MSNRFQRTETLIGEDKFNKLVNAKVIVFGIGGVGSYVVEALARAGVGTIALVDKDTVDETNINRQLIALSSTIGKLKTKIASERIKDINPDCKVITYPLFYLPETAEEIDLSEYDYIVDAIDNVTAKILLVTEAKRNNIPIISSMGTGNKLDPSGFMVADIYETSVCPLAKVMRKELRNRGVESLKVVYSKEEPVHPGFSVETENLIASRRPAPQSISFVPPVAGLIIASEVIKDIAGINR